MKKRFCLLLALLCLALTACQPTPKEEIVTHKGVESEKKWMEPAPIQETEASISEGDWATVPPGRKNI